MMLDSKMRRHVLATIGKASLLGVAGFALGGCESILKKIRERPTRRDIATLAANDPAIDTYKAAVAAMKALPASDPRSWQSQANIHQNFCPHGNWFFLPWHRAYLLYFEQICRQLTGSTEFALPYWNWTCNRTIPSIFQGGAANPLFQPGRVASPPAALADAVVGPALIDSILDETNFLIFASGAAASQRPPTPAVYGPLEGTPHNTVHGFVGGEMQTFQSPRDPIFWTHHNMIDRIWNDWNIVRGNANTNDPAWANYEFTANFVDANANPVNVKAGIMPLAPLLSYQYDDSPITACGVGRLSRAKIDAKALQRFLEEGATVRVRPLRTFQAAEALDVPVGGVVSRSLRATEPALAALAPDTRVLIRVSGVRQPPTGDFFVRVFVDLPGASASTPTSDPHFAGSFAFFVDPNGHGGHHSGADNAAFLVDATGTLQRLRSLDLVRAGQDLTVQLVAIRMTDQPLRQTSLPVGSLEVQLVQSETAKPQPFGQPAKQ